MKRVISFLLVLVMLLSLTACGKDDKKSDKDRNDRNDSVVKEEKPEETTLSPREQFQQQKEAMDALNKNDETQPAQVASASFTAGGFTLNLDSSFIAQYDQTEGLMSYVHSNGDSFSYTMKVSITRSSNYYGYTTSEEIARDIASQKPDERTVGSANGVYYIVQRGNNPVIKAYYVDDSGYYWVIDGYTRSGVNFDDYMDQLIQFCTTGKIG